MCLIDFFFLKQLVSLLFGQLWLPQKQVNRFRTLYIYIYNIIWGMGGLIKENCQENILGIKDPFKGTFQMFSLLTFPGPWQVQEKNSKTTS